MKLPTFFARIALGAAFAVSTFVANALVAQDAPNYPDVETKDALRAYQDALKEWGNGAATSEEEFWKNTAEGFYKSTKALLKRDDLTAQERLEYNETLAGIVGQYALDETLKSNESGPRFAELAQLTAQAGQTYQANKNDETRDVFLAYAKQLFGVRMRAALSLPSEARDEAFVGIVGDSITLALSFPDFGEYVYNLVMTIRANSPDLGEEALDALCDAFEASGQPALVKPIQKTTGLRRFARLPGGELYFDALLLDGDEFTKKFDWKEYEGKVLLVEVWATWCGPCRKEIPRLKEVYERYHESGLEIVGYSIDQDVDRLKSFLVENEIPWKMASQRRSVEAGYHGLYEYYSINGVPEMILIGRDGKAIQTDCRGVKLAKALEELFPNVKPLGWDPANDFSQRAQEPGK